MQTYNQTLGNLVQLKALTATDLQTNAYQNNFIAINTVEPSLGYPTTVSNSNPLSAYYFPILGTETTYLGSRRTTGLDTMYITGSTLNIGGGLNAKGNIITTGGFAVSGASTIANSLSVLGNFYVAGTATYANIATSFSTTTALSVVNLGLGPAVYVYQKANLGSLAPVAQFVAGNNCNVLFVGNNSFDNSIQSNVGIMTCSPNVSLTVVGQISSTNIITGNTLCSNNNVYGSTICGTNVCGTNVCGTNVCGTTVYGSTVCGTNVCGNFYGNASGLTNVPLGNSPYRFNTNNTGIQTLSGSNTASGSYSFVAAGSGNTTNNFANTFILGSNLSASQANFTYVNNLSSQGTISAPSISAGSFFYGDGSKLTNVSATTFTFPNNLTINSSISAPSISAGNFYGNNIFLGTISSIAALNTSPLTITAAALGSVFNQLQNITPGVSASTDISLYNDLGTNYLDIGINSSKYNGNIYTPKFNVVGANDSYFYSTSANLAHGTAGTTGDLIFFTGGSLSGTSVNSGNERLRIVNVNTANNGGYVGINTSSPNQQLTVVGNISATGTLYGTTNLPAVATFSTSVSSPSISAGNFYGDGSKLANIPLGNTPYRFNANNTGIQTLNGSNTASGTYSAILGGCTNDTKGFSNTFILGSNLSASCANFT